MYLPAKGVDGLEVGEVEVVVDGELKWVEVGLLTLQGKLGWH